MPRVTTTTTQRSVAERAVRLDAAIRIVLVVAAFAPFIGTLFYGYVYDDTGILLHNQVINGWRSLLEVWKRPYWFDGSPDSSGLYRPLLMAIFAVIWNGLHRFAIAFHFVAIALHAVTTVLTWRLLRRATGRWAATGGALWFALHPVHVEAVANIANSSETLVAVWTVLLVLLLLPGESAGDGAPSGTASWGRAALAAALYAAALLTKESGAVAPALALVAAWGWRATDPSTPVPGRRGLHVWLPAIALWGVVVVVVAEARRAVLGGLVGTVSIAAPGIAGLSAGHRVWAMLSLGGRVGRLLLWPSVQNPNYGPSVLPPPGGPTPAALATLATIAAALGASWWLARRAPSRDARALAAISWCLVAILPASNLFTATGQILAERTLYVSSIGAAMLVAWGLDRLSDVVRSGARATRPATPRLSAAVAAIAVLAFAGACVRGFVRTRDYAGVWRTHASLFAQMVRADSLNYRGYQLLALEAKRHGQRAEADRLYARAYALYPDDRILLGDYGEYLLQGGRPVEALAVGTKLLTHDDLRTDPRAVTIFLNATDQVWGVDSVLVAARRLSGAKPSARSALFVGMALEAKGDTAGARTAYRDGLRLAPQDSALLVHAAALTSRLARAAPAG
jgi:hypothetical protein